MHISKNLSTFLHAYIYTFRQFVVHPNQTFHHQVQGSSHETLALTGRVPLPPRTLSRDGVADSRRERQWFSMQDKGRIKSGTPRHERDTLVGSGSLPAASANLRGSHYLLECKIPFPCDRLEIGRDSSRRCSPR